jgi:hypothetical protein
VGLPLVSLPVLLRLTAIVLCFLLFVAQNCQSHTRRARWKGCQFFQAPPPPPRRRRAIALRSRWPARPPIMGANASKQLHNTLFELKWTSKSLVRASIKASKDEKTMKSKLKTAIEKGNYEGARIYAANVCLFVCVWRFCLSVCVCVCVCLSVWLCLCV